MMNPAIIKGLGPGFEPGQRHPDWIRLYDRIPEESLPWHLGELDPDFKQELLREPSAASKSLLDLGSGLGGQANEMARLGFSVIATDISESAVRRAKEKYALANYLVDDVRKSGVTGRFDYLTDRGCFHVLEATEHAAYIQCVQRLLRPHGTFLLKVMSSEMGRSEVGPIRFSLPSLHYIFASRFKVLKIQRTIFFGSTQTPQTAWFLVMKGNGGLGDE